MKTIKRKRLNEAMSLGLYLKFAWHQRKKKHITALEHIKMNSEFVKKKYTQFKSLKPRASNDEFWAFDSRI
jgi:hypothetical protein